jgi:hypothetical protein
MREDFRLVVGSGSSAVELAKEFAPCTNCGGDDGPWILSVLVTREGLYPFELLQYNATGDASLEWVVVTPSGSRLLINETGAGGLPAYVPAGAAPTLPVLSLQLEGNQLRLEWTGGGVLQSAPAITGPWGEVVGAGSPYTTALGTADQFYRVRR